MGCGINNRAKVNDLTVLSRSDSGFLPSMLKNYIGPDIETLSGHESLPPMITSPAETAKEPAAPSRGEETQREEAVGAQQERDRHSPTLAWVEDFSRNDKGGRPESVSIDLKFHLSSPTPLQDADPRLPVMMP